MDGLKELKNLEVGDVLVFSSDNLFIKDGKYEILGFSKCSQSHKSFNKCCEVCGGFLKLEEKITSTSTISINLIHRLCVGLSSYPHVTFKGVIKRDSWLDGCFDDLLELT